MSWIASQYDRSSRHIRRSHVRLGTNAPRQRVTVALQEALRLLNLPGENEGRVYYFRSVSLSSLPADGARNIWLESFQRVLGDLAGTAVHGSDWRASSANAIFFFNFQEALELLLGKLLHREVKEEWFWPLVEGEPTTFDRTERIARVIERLRDQPASWMAVSNILFETLSSDETLSLLASVSSSRVRGWLDELGAGQKTSDLPLRLPTNTSDLLSRAIKLFGQNDPRPLWLTSLAVGFVSPAAFSTRSVVSRARSTLEQIALHYAPSQIDENGFEKLDAPISRTLDFSDAVSSDRSIISTVFANNVGKLALPENVNAAAMETPKVAASFWVGELTQAAGLYFLLNALSRLRIARALEVCPLLMEAGLVASVLERIATQAGVHDDDPIMQWVKLERSKRRPDAPGKSFEGPTAPDAWPTNLRRLKRDLLDYESFVRIWTVAVRRWCLRSCGLTVSEIVKRIGRVSLSRTDLDVAFPLADAEVRIRLAGLDIDPGWLPWFGRVVRFHYTQESFGDSEC